MRRLLRWTGRALIIAAALLGVATVSTLTTVDSTPFQQAGYYSATLHNLDHDSQHWLVDGPLRAGYGKALLTPSLGASIEVPEDGRFDQVPLAGYGSRGGVGASGTHDDVFARAVALEVAGQRLIVLSAEALIVPSEVAEETARRLREQFNLPRAALFFGATHTHASLGGWGRGPVGEAFAGPFNPGTLEWFAQQMTAAAGSALADLEPASLGQASFSAPDHVRNRLRGSNGAVNSEFTCLWICQDDGDRAVIGSYAAHATVLPASVMEFSGDYPGAWSRELEAEGLDLALFLAGTVASHSPVAAAPGFTGVQRMGRSLARDTLGTLDSILLTNRIRLGISAAAVTLPPLQPRLSRRVCLRPWIARRLLKVSPTAWLQVAQLGQSLWIGTPCDFSGELAATIGGRLAPEGRSTVFTSFNGDYVGYVIPSHYYELPGYEPRTMAFYGPHFADYLSEMILRLGSRLTSSPEQERPGSEESGREQSVTRPR